MKANKSFADRCDAVMVASFYALVVFVPISIALVETFTVTALIAFLAKRFSLFLAEVKVKRGIWNKSSTASKLRQFFLAFKPVSNYLNGPVWAFLIVCFISTLTSTFPAVSFKGFLGKVLQNVFIFFTFIECMRSKERIRTLLFFLLISVFIVSLNGLAQYIFGQGFIFGKPIYHGRIYSSMRQANDFAAYLVILVPIVLSLLTVLYSKNSRDVFSGLFHQRTRWFSNSYAKYAVFIIFLSAIICFGLTYSRGAWIACLISLVAMFAYHRKAFLSVCLFGLIFLSIFTIKMIVERDYVDLESFFTSSGRTEYWAGAMSLLLEQPVYGTGLNTYSLIARDADIKLGGYPHNCYLQMGVELGFVGLAVFLWMFAVLFFQSIRCHREIEDHFLQATMRGFLAGLGGFLIHSFFDTFIFSVQLGSFMWVLIGVVMAVQMTNKPMEMSRV